jgi:transposase InsO family protein
MCKFLNISRSLIYYHPKVKSISVELDKLIIKIFRDSKNNYGSRKIKKELELKNYFISLRRIRKIMNKYGLVSNYTIKQFKVNKSKPNEDNVSNIVDRHFNNRDVLEVVISDLTYVRVCNSWNYVCLIIDLFNREIIGFSAGKHKDASTVEKAINSIKYDLKKISIFHTDRGSEFKNKLIEDILIKFDITRSLSNKGTPYDNAVAEATYKIFKTEFCFNRKFNSFEQLELELFDYVNWFNNFRIHGSLDYLTPMQYKSVHI